MLREEAIFCEKSYIGETNCTDCKYYGTDTCKSRESHKMAIKALEQESRWIPVSERLPEEDTDVLVTLKCGLIGIMQKKLADDDNGEPCYIWEDFEGEEHEVIAWMPLPKAYKEVEE